MNAKLVMYQKQWCFTIIFNFILFWTSYYLLLLLFYFKEKQKNNCHQIHQSQTTRHQNSPYTRKNCSFTRGHTPMHWCPPLPPLPLTAKNHSWPKYLESGHPNLIPLHYCLLPHSLKHRSPGHHSQIHYQGATIQPHKKNTKKIIW